VLIEALDESGVSTGDQGALTVTLAGHETPLWLKPDRNVYGTNVSPRGVRAYEMYGESDARLQEIYADEIW
jgi:hypothetical protein